MIIRNAAQCGVCQDILESHHVHDFKSCSCGSIFVDGGREYIRHGFTDRSAIINLSVVEDGS